MFKTGAFKHIACPYFPDCYRGLDCWFDHRLPKPPVEPAEQLAAAKRTAPPETKADVVEPEAKRRKLQNGYDGLDSTIAPPKEARVEPKAPSHSRVTVVERTKPKPAPAPAPKKPAKAPTDAEKPPFVALHVHNKVPIHTRQKAVDKFFEEFRRIYGPKVLADVPDLAHRHALEQEERVHEKSTALTYKQEAANMLGRLRRRPHAQSADDVGIEGEYKSPEERERDRVPKVMLSGEVLRPHILDSRQRQDYGYLALDFLETLDVFEEAVSESREKTCERCGLKFAVKSELSEEDLEACKHHRDRPRVEKSGGEKKQVYPCCGVTVGSSTTQAGCSTGPHVFIETDSALLHSSSPFSSLPDRTEGTEKADVVGLDCEMVFTSLGFEVARASLVDGKGEVLLDAFVRPRGSIIDLNTRWSGITPEHIERPDALTFEGLRTRMAELMDAETVIVGHGLENDLRVLRLLHEPIVDTAVLFPHPKGLPMRNGLRFLSERHLGRLVQQGGAGHDSVEDAICALQLAAHFLKQNKS
ncbi:hypothetical protein DFJ74DRAFT_119568 [Hyaloraphidium curvatum]|nr:hypothetical protein DFJ74DRAFT_119568 [Hyaloraphidium curvatum]